MLKREKLAREEQEISDRKKDKDKDKGKDKKDKKHHKKDKKKRKKNKKAQEPEFDGAKQKVVQEQPAPDEIMRNELDEDLVRMAQANDEETI